MLDLTSKLASPEAQRDKNGGDRAWVGRPSRLRLVARLSLPRPSYVTDTKLTSGALSCHALCSGDTGCRRPLECGETHPSFCPKHPNTSHCFEIKCQALQPAHNLVISYLSFRWSESLSASSFISLIHACASPVLPQEKVKTWVSCLGNPRWETRSRRRSIQVSVRHPLTRRWAERRGGDGAWLVGGEPCSPWCPGTKLWVCRPQRARAAKMHTNQTVHPHLPTWGGKHPRTRPRQPKCLKANGLLGPRAVVGGRQGPRGAGAQPL